ncbi:SLC13 family permease [Pseudomonas aeruginosa]|uniref:SLC13 family permease n=1 Tax=Pseudomonas aeruginosa TaxID=287 RepID=UPI0033967539
MNLELLWVVGLLATTVALFIHNRLRLDVIALLVIMAFSVSGTLTLNEALAGFSDPSVILIAALFVIGESLVRTGVAYQVGDWLIARAGSSEARLLVLLMLAVAGLGSVMSSTGVVAIFIPVVLSIAAKLKIPPGRLMMPLAFAGLISGMMTLVATPPNMVVNSELAREGHAGFGFFAFTPIGLMVLAIGVAYMLLTRNWLNAASPAEVGAPKARRTLRDLIRDYRLAGRERRLQVQLGSPLIGSPLEELQLRTRLGANVVGLERVRKFHSEVVKVGGSTELKAGDVLLLDVFAPPEDMDRRCAELNLVRLPFRASYFIDQSREVGMAEVTLPPDSTLLGKSVLELGFRSQYGLNVVGLRRDHEALTDGMLEEKLRLGDTLLVIGAWKAIRQLQGRNRDFLVLSLPAEIDEVAPALSKAPHALLSLAVMVALMVSGVVPNVVAALVGCLLMGLFRCIDMDGAYRAIHWQSLVLIVGMLPFALALQKTGGIDLVVSLLVDALGDAGPRVLLASLFLLTAAIGLFISNTATAVLMAPIAIATAKQIGASPYPFAMVVAVAASAAFMTPISSPVNTLVLGPGQYRFGDFVRIGVPFTLLVMFVCVLVIPWLFPL